MIKKTLDHWQFRYWYKGCPKSLVMFETKRDPHTRQRSQMKFPFGNMFLRSNHWFWCDWICLSLKYFVFSLFSLKLFKFVNLLIWQFSQNLTSFCKMNAEDLVLDFRCRHHTQQDLFISYINSLSEKFVTCETSGRRFDFHSGDRFYKFFTIQILLSEKQRELQNVVSSCQTRMRMRIKHTIVYRIFQCSLSPKDDFIVLNFFKLCCLH